MPQSWLDRATRFVAQISNQLYRRIPFGRPSLVCSCTNFSRFADWKSAIQQIANLRYSRARLRHYEFLFGAVFKTSRLGRKNVLPLAVRFTFTHGCKPKQRRSFTTAEAQSAERRTSK